MPNPQINKIHQGDVLEVLQSWPAEFVDCVVTSPPYWGLRDYGVEGQLGLEREPEEYTEKMVCIFREIKRVLKSSGTLWLNLGDSYNNYPGGITRGGRLSGRQQHARAKRPTGYGLASSTLKPKDLVGIPWRIALALQADGWWLRSDILWHKPNPMPAAVRDRPATSHEYIFLLSKSVKYFYDADAIREPYTIKEYLEGIASAKKCGYDEEKQEYREWYLTTREGKDWVNKAESGDNLTYGQAKKNNKKAPPNLIHPDGRNKRTVWEVPTAGYKKAHFATVPENLIKPCILAGCPRGGGVCLDPFMGSGTTAAVARDLMRNYIGIELNPEYIKLAEDRLRQMTIMDLQ